jgi:hypothetical protein
MGYNLGISRLDRLQEAPMRGRKTALVVLLTDQERQQLTQWVRSTTMPVGLVKRAHTVLLAADGLPLSHIARRVGLTQKHVRQWITRFIKERIAGLSDRAGRGRKPSFSP